VAQAQQANDPPPAPGTECVAGVGPGCDDDMRDGRMADRGEGRHGGRHEGRGHGGRHGGPGMRMIDANADGAIGDDEAAAMADHAFNRMDDDRDGKVTEAEFAQGPRGKRGGWFNWSQAETDAVMKVRKDKFASLDANKDASLDKTEFFADAKARLTAADTDKDGKVTPWEFRAAN
jgi:Ca2+-binding EF-hand superfamily protein